MTVKNTVDCSINYLTVFMYDFICCNTQRKKNLVKSKNLVKHQFPTGVQGQKIPDHIVSAFRYWARCNIFFKRH